MYIYNVCYLYYLFILEYKCQFWNFEEKFPIGDDQIPSSKYSTMFLHQCLRLELEILGLLSHFWGDEIHLKPGFCKDYIYIYIYIYV